MKLRVARKVWREEYGDGCASCLESRRDWTIYRRSTLRRARARLALRHPHMRSRPFLSLTLPSVFYDFPRQEVLRDAILAHPLADPAEMERTNAALRAAVQRLNQGDRTVVFHGIDLGVGEDPVTFIDLAGKGLTPEVLEEARKTIYGTGGYSISGVVVPAADPDKP